MRHLLRFSLTLLVIGVLASCEAQVEEPVSRDDSSDITALATAIKSLNPSINSQEADRAAQIAYEHTQKLAIAYEITDAPLIHNAKVNRGEKPRGLCWHWADDMETRLKRERFKTIKLHRAIANAFNPILIDHSTVIVSGLDDDMRQGIIVDPWRFGGVLYWSPLRKDDRYAWVPREEVFAKRRALGIKPNADAEPEPASP